MKKRKLVGKCARCGVSLWEGDLGHRDEDGEVVCAAHAPTWAEMKNGEPVALEGGGDEIDEAAQDHIAAGGAITDRVIHVL